MGPRRGRPGFGKIFERISLIMLEFRKDLFYNVSVNFETD